MTSVEITGQNIGAMEWIGLTAKVVASTQESRAGASGRVVKETKNTVVLEGKNGDIVLPKPEVTLEFEVNGKRLVVRMDEWCFRPEDRIKAWARKNR